MIELGNIQRTVNVPSKLLVENERDWEHLPHVHNEVFSSISLVSADRTGWKANATLVDGGSLNLCVEINEDQLGWTQVSSMEGVEIGKTVTSLQKISADETKITVVFFSPDEPGLDKESVLLFYQQLYQKLLAEDERKVLARAESIAAGREWKTQSRIVTVADGSQHRIPLACPHRGLPLTCEPDGDGVVTCPWHGYKFDVRTGECVSGQINGWKVGGEMK